MGGVGEDRDRRRQGSLPAAGCRNDSAGLLISLARQEHPDTSAYNDPEIVWRLNDKKHHVGLIVKSPDPGRVQELIGSYVQRFRQDFFASQPPLDKPNY